MEIKEKYLVSDALKAFLDIYQINVETLAIDTGISKISLLNILNGKEESEKILEKLFSYFYSSRSHFNLIKEELLKESSNETILFHGSKVGLKEINHLGSKETSDFGKGLYLGETYSQALTFVCEYPSSSVYSFSFNDSSLNIVRFSCAFQWMIAICYYRGTLGEYASKKIVVDIINKIEKADLIIAPIADNRMFYIMSLFTSGEINSEVAIHSLYASRLGNQYVFKTAKAINCLKPIEKYYLCEEEKAKAKEDLVYRSYEIDTKLKLVKRKYIKGKYIEELLK